MTNLSKINILYAPVDNTHHAKNGLKKEKSSVLYAAIYSTSKCLAIWHGLPDITLIALIKVNLNNAQKSAILDLIKLKILPAIPLPEDSALFYSNLALWHGLPDIKHIKFNYGGW